MNYYKINNQHAVVLEELHDKIKQELSTVTADPNNMQWITLSIIEQFLASVTVDACLYAKEIK